MIQYDDTPDPAPANEYWKQFVGTGPFAVTAYVGTPKDAANPLESMFREACAAAEEPHRDEHPVPDVVVDPVRRGEAAPSGSGPAVSIPFASLPTSLFIRFESPLPCDVKTRAEVLRNGWGESPLKRVFPVYDAFAAAFKAAGVDIGDVGRDEVEPDVVIEVSDG